MANNFGISFTIGALLSPNVSGAFSSLNTQLRQMQQAFRQANAESARITQALEARQRRDFAASQAKQQLKLTGEVDPALRQELARLNAAYAEAARKAGVYGQSVEQINQRQRQLADSARQTEAQIQRLNAIQQSQNQLMQASQTRVQALGSAFALLAQSMALVAPLKIGADFEAAMSKVAAVTGATGEEFAKLQGQARELGATTEWSAKQAAEGMQALAMAGFKTSEIMQAMPGMLNLASAGATDLGRAADIASNILSGMGIEAAKMGDVADILVKTFTTSNTTIESLGEAFKMCAPAAHAAGQSIQDMAAMIGKLGDAGQQGTMAGTALNAIIMRMAAPPKEAAEALSLLGVSAADADGKMRPLPDVLAELGAKMSQMSEQERLDFSKQIFGMENAKAGIILMEQAFTGSLQKMSQSLNEQGAAAEVAKKQNDNLAGDLKTLSSAAQEVGISLYNTLQPALRDLAQGVVPVVQAFGEWINENPRLVQGLALVAGAIAALKTAALAFTVINSYRQTFSAGLTQMQASAGSSLASIKGAFGSLRAELARPVGNPLASLTAGATALKGRLDTMRASVGQAIAKLREFSPAAAAAGAAAKASGVAAAAGRAGWNTLRLGVKGVGLAFKTMFGPMQLIITGLTLAVEQIIANWDKIGPYFEALWNGIKNIFTAAVGWLKPIVDKIAGLIAPIINGVKSVASLVDKGLNWIFGDSDEDRKKAAAEEEARKKSENDAIAVKTTAEAHAEQVQAEQAQEQAQNQQAENPASPKQPAPDPQVAAQPKLQQPAPVPQVAAQPKLQQPAPVPQVAAQPSLQQPAPNPQAPVPVRIEQPEPVQTTPSPQAEQAQARQTEAPQQPQQPEKEIIQPQVQVELSITQNGIPDAEFAQGVMNAIKSRQSELEQMISAIVNEQARLAYG